MFFLNLIGIIIQAALGGYILFVGRRALWATLGIVALAAAGNLLAVLVAGLDSGRDLIGAQEWLLFGIAVAVGALGVFLGRTKPDLAVLCIGFIAGADAALWFYDISTYVVIRVAHESEQTAVMVGVIVLFIGGLLGLWLVRKARDEALIFITMLVGAKLIQAALGFSTTSSWTAVIMITLTLAGVLVQYAVYLREMKASELTPVRQAYGGNFYQDLE